MSRTDWCALPDECLALVAGHLPPADRASFELTCRAFCAVSVATPYHLKDDLPADLHLLLGRMPEERRRRYEPLLRIMAESVLRFLRRRAPRPRPVLLSVDTFTAGMVLSRATDKLGALRDLLACCGRVTSLELGAGLGARASPYEFRFAPSDGVDMSVCGALEHLVLHEQLPAVLPPRLKSLKLRLVALRAAVVNDLLRGTPHLTSFIYDGWTYMDEPISGFPSGLRLLSQDLRYRTRSEVSLDPG